ncbi:MAG: hypothetical protein ACR5KV_02645 [Wolbachia sp.]
MHGDKICNLYNSLEFTLESQDGENLITYVDSELLLTLPEELKNCKEDKKTYLTLLKSILRFSLKS